MAKFKVLDTELELDLLDADELDRLDNALHAAETAAQMDDKLSQADNIRKQVGAVRMCFDTIFGVGTGAKVLGPKDHLGRALTAFGQLCDESARQRVAFGKEVAAMQAKYSPNRAARRAAGKSK